MKQTAVEWLAENVDNLIPFMNDSIAKKFRELIEQSKEMEKEQSKITENTSDGYHTFKDLYEFRKAYNVALFNEWGEHVIPTYEVHKSWKHNNGELCFGGGWFIVVAILPSGQISNHYKAEDWDLFKIPEVEKAKYIFDGHTSKDVIERLLTIQKHI
jgi:uncharacterized protein (DUF488 family)